MPIRDLTDRALREYRRYTGDGLPNQPIGAPLPIGDPSSGVHNPSKAELRNAFGDAGDAIDTAKTAAAASATSAAGSAAAAASAVASAVNIISLQAYNPAGDGTTDDTAKIQSAIDATPEGGTLIFGGAHYAMTRVNITKAITIDLNGSDLTIAPTSGGGTNPAFYFSGTLGTRRAINTPTVSQQDRLTLVDVAHAADFAAGDYVEILDNTVVPGWAVSASSYSTRKEINRIKSVQGSTLFLERSIEWQYDNGATATVAKMTPLVGPRIINSGTITETDPGAAYVGTTVNGPHVFGFYLCVDPLVSDITIEKWQMHGVQFHMCERPIVQRMTGYRPYRPTQGGHAYLVQFAQSTGGLARDCVGYGCRHVIDFTQCYDCVSQGNKAFAPYGFQYTGHGQGAKRCKSIDDYLNVGGGDGPLGWGWGNPTFSQDYDFEVIRPVAYGRADAPSSGCIVFLNGSKSERMTIIEPKVEIFSDSTNAAFTKVCWAEQGAIDTEILGGYIDISAVSSSATDAAVEASDANEPPVNLRVIGTTILGPAAANTGIIWAKQLSGAIEVRNVRSTANVATAHHVRIDPTGLAEINVSENHFFGGGIRGVLVSSAASQWYRVFWNRFQGTFSTATETLDGAPFTG